MLIVGLVDAYAARGDHRVRLLVEGKEVWVCFCGVRNGRGVLGIDAPPEVSIQRESRLPEGERYKANQAAKPAQVNHPKV